jgi:hypothetical protein
MSWNRKWHIPLGTQLPVEASLIKKKKERERDYQ